VTGPVPTEDGASESLWRVPEVAERLSVSPKTVYKYVAAEGLPCIRLRNRTLRFSPQQVQGWLEARTHTVAAPSDLDRVLEQVAPTLLRLPPGRQGPSA
jgi:excisionase family DNA binding protein